jgi:acyl dehydratase
MRLERVGAVSPPSRRRWEPRDCSLYALALGAGWEQLPFVTEGTEESPQLVYPTFVLAGVCAAESQSWPDPGFATGDYAPHQLVLASQSLELARPVAPRGDVTVRTRVAGIDDKGSGALVRLEIVAADTGSGVLAFRAGVALFVIGGGGFGGSRGPRDVGWRTPARPPDRRVAYDTSPLQTLLYRHAGKDANAIHVDPAVAERAGFKGPILSGQNTLGFAGRAIVEAVAGGDPTLVRSIEGRFAAPGYNGDRLVTEMWFGMGVGADAHGRLVVCFRVRNQDGAVLVDRGRATLA